MISFENFIKDRDSDTIEDILFCNNFPWFYVKKSVEHLESNSEDYITTAIMRHWFCLDWNKRETCEIVKPIIDRVESLFSTEILWYNITSNLLLPSHHLIGKLCPPHIDVNYDENVLIGYDSYTGIYYVNDVDGDTVLFNEKHDGSKTIKNYNKFTEFRRITPQKNKFVYWNTNRFHSAPASSSQTRSTINFNFLVRNKEWSVLNK